ncbi:DUF3052 family protein [Rhabdobacter roseus]|uniref:DUF3052 domain-containing protein n=1 Tax=Rhabdobacter roseus TaxID=1655419 RepID=A0A840TW02_9BACT|nr:hypothetical protein [Rhabdobacter roseus]MBB5285762.1 hypothetical protein [Rhabdobacter roseus]
MTKTVAEKMGIRENARAILFNAAEAVTEVLALPKLDLQSSLQGYFDYIHFFVYTQAEFHAYFPKLKKHLGTDGVLWVSWPKAGQKGTDLNLTIVIKLGYEYGLVESKCLSVDQVWSALKFTHPIPGKVYNNSYGTLTT